MTVRRFLAVAVAGAAVVTGLSARAADDTRLVARGHAVAEAGCSRCHSIGTQGQSPRAKAPPFRRLHEDYPVADLIAALSEGASPSHPGMHRFHLAPSDAQALTAYIQSLEH